MLRTARSGDAVHPLTVAVANRVTGQTAAGWGQRPEADFKGVDNHLRPREVAVAAERRAVANEDERR